MNREEAIQGINDKLKDLKYYAKEMGEVLKSTNHFIDELEEQIRKVEQKPKAYHVKDEYSYDCLMEELEEQGYRWRVESTEKDIWSNYKEETIVYCEEDKYLEYSDLTYYKTNEKDEYNLIEYYKEPPRFYAKIKGWELTKDGDCYWYKDKYESCGVYPWSRENASIFTKEKWTKLGITEENAVFEEIKGNRYGKYRN